MELGARAAAAANVPCTVAAARHNVALIKISGRDTTMQRAAARPFVFCDCGITSYSGSGIVVSNRDMLIVTSASLLAPFRPSRSGSLLLPDTKVEVLLERVSAPASPKSAPPPSSAAEWFWVQAELLDVVATPRVDSAIEAITQHGLQWKLGWPVAKAAPGAAAAASSASDTAPTAANNQNAAAATTTTTPPAWFVRSLQQRDWSVLSALAILRVRDEEREAFSAARASVRELALAPSWMFQRGRAVVSISSPYGMMSPPTFFNTCSVGVLSNVTTSSDAGGGGNGERLPVLLISDAHCSPGSEGGAIIDLESGLLLGMTQPPLRSTADEIVLQFGVSSHELDAVLKQFASQLAKAPPSAARLQAQTTTTGSVHMHMVPSLQPTSQRSVAGGGDAGRTSLQGAQAVVAQAQRSVALIEIGSHWASGIIVSDEGHIVTNAHLFQPFLRGIADPTDPKALATLRPRVLIGYPNAKVAIEAQVQFVSPSCLDLALLKVTAPFECEWAALPVAPIMHGSLRQGHSAIVLGHAVFGAGSDLLPTCTTGVVTNVVQLEGKTTMIQTDAAVHKGNSGGPLLSRSGQLIGIITCNARDTDGLTVPRMNFSLAADLLVPLVAFARTGERHVLQSIAQQQSEEMEALWQLQYGGPKPLLPALSAKVRQMLEQAEQQQQQRGACEALPVAKL